MYCPPLKYQGTWIDKTEVDPDRAFNLLTVFHALESSLVEAAISLDLFEHAESELQEHYQEKPLPIGFPTRLHSLPFIHARSFVHSLHNILKFIDVAVELSGGSSGIEDARREFASGVPDLKGVRDSEQHIEERLLGMVRGGKLPTSQLWIGNLNNNGKWRDR